MTRTPSSTAAPSAPISVAGTGIVTAAGRGGARTMESLACGGTGPAAPRTIRCDPAGANPVFEVSDDALAGFSGRLPGGCGRRSLRLALVAASDAVNDAAAAGFTGIEPDRVGVVVGATSGGMNHAEDWIEAWCVSGPAGPGSPQTTSSSESGSGAAARTLARRAAIRHMPLWEVPRVLAARFGFRGPAFAVSTACTSGAQALATAADLITTGVCDAVLAGGVDCLTRMTYHGFAALGVMSPRRCSPFDARRLGLNLGEGAAFAFLVRADLDPGASGRAGARDGARLPVLAGWGSNTDAHHATAPRPDGSGVAAAVRDALAGAGIGPRDVSWVHAHGTATTTNDAVEARGLRAVFGSRRVPVSSTKHVFGHTLGAAGAISSVVAVHAMRTGFVPGNAPIEAPDGDCDLDLVPPSGVRAPVRHAVVSSLGFGGANCALVFSEAAS